VEYDLFVERGRYRRKSLAEVLPGKEIRWVREQRDYRCGQMLIYGSSGMTAAPRMR